MRLIDAERLKEVFERNTGYDYHDVIDIQPTVEERHRGKWILCTDGRYYCQECHIRKPDFAWDYCPQCGALMSKLQANGEQVKPDQWCKFKSEKNCDFCAFHSDCEIHWKDGDE